MLAICLPLLSGCVAHRGADDLILPPRPEPRLVLPGMDEEKPGGAPDHLPPPRPVEGDKGIPVPERRDGKGLTLGQAIRLCLQADPKLKAASEAVVQAQAELVKAGTRPNPSLDTYLTQYAPFPALTLDRSGNSPVAGFDLSYPIDWFIFGKLAAAESSARLGLEEAEYGYAEATRQRVGEVVLAWLDAVEAKALERLARQDLEAARRTEEALDKAVKAGGKSDVDLSRIRLDRLKVEQALRDAEAAYSAALVKLGSLLGRQAGDAPGVDGDLGNEVPAWFLPAEGAFETALRGRPDILAARASVEKARADIVLEDAKGRPSVRPRLQVQEQLPYRRIAYGYAQYLGVGLVMDLPCYDRNQGDRLKARSRLVQEEMGYRTKVVELRAEVDRLLQDYNASRARASATARQQELSAQIRDAVMVSYGAGGKPLL
ncbi:MAG: TolC family protein, partial [Gemmataceae bacterium]|nr:TolC family protein [Gemmataceae bacterium]